jgi:hypothetical protein
MQFIIDAMKAHPSNLGVNKEACNALGALSFNNPGYQAAIVAAGGIMVC